MICPHGGMTILRHNEIRDMTADWLDEVCTETEKEPQLQPVTGECLYPQSANRKAEARPDIKAKGSGVANKVHFLMSGFFTPTHQVIATPLLVICIEAKRT